MAIDSNRPATVSDIIPKLVTRLRENYNHGITKPITYRLEQLDGLLRFLEECESKIFKALKSDLNKCKAEALATEIQMLTNKIKFIKNKLHRWVKPKKVSTSMIAQPGSSYIYPEPLGVVLVIAPWNYPLLLSLEPAIGALAAGNCVVIKPSELSTATSQLLASELPQYVDKDCLCVIEGDAKETTTLLAEKFDYIFYTGNGNVGRIVMTAAAKHLTPVTLELGGKSPCIIDATTNIDVAARRVAWGKFMNAGQTCVAPDYVLVEASVEKQFLEALKANLQHFFGNNPAESQDYGRIINHRHFQRLMKLLPDSGDVYLGGNTNESDRYIAPTILCHVPENSPVMAEEIFGPILPVLAVKNVDAAIQFINARPRPLALYLFSADKATHKRVINETSSGGIGINSAVLQIAVEQLPFGGVGQSGTGNYHGKYSFDTFSHFKSVLVKPTWFDLAMVYPPYSKLFLKMIRWL